jgi:hypothetical protein
MSLIQIEQERPGLWKAEVEAITGFGTARRVMLHDSTFDGVMAKVAETYREMVPLPAAEPVDAPNPPEASEAGEIETDRQAGSAERRGPAKPRKGA